MNNEWQVTSLSIDMKIALIVIGCIIFYFIAKTNFNYDPATYYLVFYVHQKGNGTIRVAQLEGGELDLSTSLDFISKPENAEGKALIASFQKITKQQYLDLNKAITTKLIKQ